MTDTKTVDLDWNNLGFEYMDLPYRYRAYWKDGEWHKAGLVEDSSITINEGSPIVHYGQGCFEGMKAYRQSFPSGSKCGSNATQLSASFDAGSSDGNVR